MDRVTKYVFATLKYFCDFFTNIFLSGHSWWMRLFLGINSWDGSDLHVGGAAEEKF